MAKPRIAQVSGARMLEALRHRAMIWHLAAVWGLLSCVYDQCCYYHISSMSPEQVLLFSAFRSRSMASLEEAFHPHDCSFLRDR